jgi:hypothetical protein
MQGFVLLKGRFNEDVCIDPKSIVGFKELEVRELGLHEFTSKKYLRIYTSIASIDADISFDKFIACLSDFYKMIPKQPSGLMFFDFTKD